MPEHKLCVPCLFGLEGPLGNELRHMGLRDVMPENGRVRCTGTDADIARMNIRCRFGERSGRCQHRHGRQYAAVRQGLRR